jgi:hypothetical protein
MGKTTIMKNMIRYAGIFIGNVTPAWAATNGREDNSDLFVWIFLAFCALIIVAQLIPAIMMVMGFSKGVKKEVPITVPVAAEQKAATDR